MASAKCQIYLSSNIAAGEEVGGTTYGILGENFYKTIREDRNAQLFLTDVLRLTRLQERDIVEEIIRFHSPKLTNC